MADEDNIQEKTVEEEIQIPERKTLFTLIKEWPLSRKIALVAVSCISIALFAVIIIQARTADYQLLYANLAEKDAASVVAWLKGERIDYQLKNNGKNIWISANNLYETRLNLASNGFAFRKWCGFLKFFDKQSLHSRILFKSQLHKGITRRARQDNHLS